MEDIEDFKKSIGKKSRLLGIDPGKKRVGIAISDENKLVSTPLKTIKKKNTNLINEILKIIKENNIKGIVVGNPINMDGSEGPRCDSTRDFAHAFLRIYTIPICFHDERLSTIAANNILRDSDISRQKKITRQDAIAASWILQSLLDIYNNNNLEGLDG